MTTSGSARYSLLAKPKPSLEVSLVIAGINIESKTNRLPTTYWSDLMTKVSCLFRLGAVVMVMDMHCTL